MAKRTGKCQVLLAPNQLLKLEKWQRLVAKTSCNKESPYRKSCVKEDVKITRRTTGAKGNNFMRVITSFNYKALDSK